MRLGQTPCSKLRIPSSSDPADLRAQKQRAEGVVEGWAAPNSRLRPFFPHLAYPALITAKGLPLTLTGPFLQAKQVLTASLGSRGRDRFSPCPAPTLVYAVKKKCSKKCSTTHAWQNDGGLVPCRSADTSQGSPDLGPEPAPGERQDHVVPAT